MVITSFSLKFLRSSSVVATGLLRVNTPPTVALTRTAVGSFCQFVPKSSSLLQEVRRKEVATKTIAVSASNNVEVNTANLSAGSYIYKVFAGDKVATGKLIKQ